MSEAKLDHNELVDLEGSRAWTLITEAVHAAKLQWADKFAANKPMTQDEIQYLRGVLHGLNTAVDLPRIVRSQLHTRVLQEEFEKAKKTAEDKKN